ncbi:beta-1,3-glucan-binding protein 1-like [Onthophagus taurus]|uniref:beta-1,3-glucan-binding protein 1-like n=1 Tax=Onthophagus taurus TaxID=166361 RepID=UPI0039BE9146
MSKMLRFFIVLLLISVTLSEFTFEPVILAHKPKGFTTYIEGNDLEDVKEFRFLGRLNNGRSIIIWATKLDSNGRWSSHNRNLKLNIGDEISFEVTVWKKDKTEYSKNAVSTILYYTPLNGECLETQTLTPGLEKKHCGSDLLFEDDFVNENLNSSVWNIEQYIPQYTEDNYEFVSYQDSNDCKFISNSRLFIKPTVRAPEEMDNILDLRQGCTKSLPESCYHQPIGPYINPPIKSTKIFSKFAFKYGRIEIGAKLPVGDWIYPQVELVPNHVSRKYPKIVIAYSRGNPQLTLKNGDDIGNNILYGGFVSDYKEPERSAGLKSKVLSEPNKEIKKYSVVWTPDMLLFAYDNEVYGRIKIAHKELSDYRIAFGVGVGGNFDFPNEAKSGNKKKPWLNNDSKQAKKFLNAKDEWFSTWIENDVALQIDYVRVYAL